LIKRSHSPLHNFEHALHPYSAYFIMPLFALFNAGVALGGSEEGSLVSLATLGVFLGLLVGKPLGVFGATWLAVQLRITKLPSGVNWEGVVGVGFLAGIGFTMALFIANLAFGEGVALDQAKIGILSASVVAAIAGLVFLERNLAQAPSDNS
ncbi:MAG: Na+/H+ antiporter NhaA, partial [Pseudomonadota bacterium]